MSGNNDTVELMYLARTIYGEARSSSYAAKVAVGWTIRNRVDMHRSSYRKIVTKPFQYDCWMPKDPNYREIQHPTQMIAWHESLRAAREIFYADSSKDPVRGATHYYSPKAQAFLHAREPGMYPAMPKFIVGGQEVPSPPGVSWQEFRFYRNVR